MEGRHHLIGIKGTGVSGLACLLHDWGVAVSGSDIPDFVFTQVALEERGIQVQPFAPSNVHGATTVIRSAAFGPSNPEVAEAMRLELPIFTYPEYLGVLTARKETMCISGTHGKTTTSGMVARVWEAAGRDPSYLIGDGTGHGRPGPELVLEACEYRRHFLNYTPRDAVILNIDFDHPDYFRDLMDTKEAFGDFAARAGELVVGWGDDTVVRAALKPLGKKAVYFGEAPNNDYVASRLQSSPTVQQYMLHHHGTRVGRVKLAVPGTHNVLNSLAAATLALERGLPFQAVAAGLATYRGARRRFEVTEVGHGFVVDDYAHHPAEIAAAIGGARQRFPQRRLVAAFQPHTYTRTEAFLREFAQSLALADEVLVTEIFGSARENSEGFSAAAIVEAMDARKARFVTLDQLEVIGREALEEGDVLLLLGAGDMYKVKKRW
jgi:UDP-N-acetylmuramate--alanine ligase